MKTLIILLAVTTAGCAHFGHTAANPPSAPHSATQVIPVADAAAPPTTFPAQFEEYYVGMIGDSEDPNFAYRPGRLVAQTRPSRFGFEESNGVWSRGPETTARMTNDHPDPTDTEMATLAMRSRRTIAALSEEVESLRAQRHPEAATNAVSGASTSGPLQDVASTAAPAEHLNVIEPNADNVIALDPNLVAPNQPETNNPFVQLYQPPVSWRDMEIRVSAAVPGPHPSAVIDDEPYSVGDSFKDMTVYRVGLDRVFLKKDSFLLDCPVSEKPIKLRLP